MKGGCAEEREWWRIIKEASDGKLTNRRKKWKKYAIRTHLLLCVQKVVQSSHKGEWSAGETEKRKGSGRAE